MPIEVIIVYSVTLIAIIGYAYSVWTRSARLRREAEERNIKH